jgi:cytochrome c556
MNKFIFVVAFALATASVVFAHEGHEHATGVVRERMELMTDLGHRLVAISKRLRANKELDRIPDDARAIGQLAVKITPIFPPGSTQAPTAAKPAVWENWADFTAKAQALASEADKLTATSAADGKALRAQFLAVAYACDECHDKYRMTGRK